MQVEPAQIPAGPPTPPTPPQPTSCPGLWVPFPLWLPGQAALERWLETSSARRPCAAAAVPLAHLCLWAHPSPATHCLGGGTVLGVTVAVAGARVGWQQSLWVPFSNLSCPLEPPWAPSLL